jgi:hypothetical protein
MTTMMEYAMVRLELGALTSRFDPRATPVGPTRMQRVRARIRNLF